MTEKEEIVRQLLHKYLSNECSPAEAEELFESIRRDEANEILSRNMEDEFIPENVLPHSIRDAASSRIRENLELYAGGAPVRSLPGGRRKWLAVASAAIVLFVLSFWGYLYFNPESLKKPSIVQQKNSYDVSPGGNKALLTLNNGTVIVLNEVETGVLSQQGNVLVSKTKDGQVVYRVSAPPGAGSGSNTITTPRGGQYEVVLPDGTKVWLNAASSLTFPVSFKGTERKVTLSGEAYFEVTSNRQMPFRVITDKMNIEVLGTHFNVMAYDDENSIRTTLLEGSVKIGDGQSQRVIVPGQQAVLNKQSGYINIQEADIEEVIAWKNGYFMFASENIESVMRKISRWYDVDVVYSDELKKIELWGTVSRYVNVSDVLQALELTGVVHFRLEERRIQVMP